LSKKGSKAYDNILKMELQDKKISFAIVFQFSMLITNYTIKYVFSITTPSTREIISFTFMLIVGMLFLKNLNTVLKRIGKLFIGTYAIFAFIFLINMLMFTENMEYIIDASFWFFLICLPLSLYYIAIKNKGIFLDMLIKSAYYQIALAILFFTISIFKDPAYDMVYSYLIMVPIIILLYKNYNKLSILDSILILIGLFSIVAIGSRGPILSIILFSTTLIFVYSFQNRNKLKTIIISFLGFVTVTLGFVYFKELLYRVNILLINFGINSRTMYSLMNSNLDFLSGRGYIYELTVQKIFEKPIIGYGLAGDRIFLNGTYPHNIFLEVLSQFGIIIGFTIIIIFIFYWINGVLLNRNKEERDIAILFFGIGLVQLFISGSYISSSNFWLFMAICISSVHFKKNNIKYNSKHLKYITTHS